MKRKRKAGEKAKYRRIIDREEAETETERLGEIMEEWKREKRKGKVVHYHLATKSDRALCIDDFQCKRVLILLLKLSHNLC